MTFTPWAPTVGASLSPLSLVQGGTGGQLPWVAADDGFLIANSDPSAQSGGGVAIAGTLYMQRLNPRINITLTNLYLGVSVIGVNTAGTSFVGLYSASGTLLTGSADMSGQFTGTTGWKQLALSTPQALTAGTVYFAAVLNNLTTTQPSFIRQGNSVNADPQATVNLATQRWGQFPAVGGTLPASVTMASMAATAFTYVVLGT